MNENIEKGDIVRVDFNNSQMTLTSRAKVLYTPCATGDSWRFQDTERKRIYYVSEGCTITLIEKYTK